MGEWETKLTRMESLFQEQIQHLVTQNDQLKAEVEELESQRTVQQAESLNLKQQLERLAAPESRAAPRNCLALTQIGHRLSGLYMVQSATNQIQTVYCNINNVTGAVGNSIKIRLPAIKLNKFFKILSSRNYFRVQRC